MKLSRSDAEEFASWFKRLGEPSRLEILNLLAISDRPLTVGEIVDAVDIGQSTVSHHLKILAEIGFVLMTKAGTSRLYEFNRNCFECFPSAADTVLGKAPAEQVWND